MVRSLVALVALVVVALALPARADSPHVAEARAAVDEVRYDDAQKLLVAAIQDGGNSPAAMIEIYQLSATTAVVLDQKDLAEQYYRRLLALQPAFRIADDVAPKLREPFVAAQAYIAAHGKLEATVARRPGALAVIITVDPLAMAHGAELIVGGAASGRIALDGAKATLPTTDRTASVAIVDDRGNQLVIIAADAIADAAPDVVAPVERARPTPWIRRWTTWLVPTAVAAAVGTGFAIDASLADARLSDILADSGNHTFPEAETERKRRDRSALVANISFATAGAFAVVTTIMIVTRPRGTTTVVPSAGPDQVGAAVVGRW